MSKRDFVAPGVYTLLFPDGSIYVGATNNLHARLREHMSSVESGRHSNLGIRSLAFRFGPESLEIFVPHRAPHFDRPWDLSAWLYGAELTAYERLLASGAPVLNLERPKRISPRPRIKRAAPREHFTQMIPPSAEVQSVGLCAMVHRPTNRVLLGASINRTDWHYQQRNHCNAGRHSNPVWRNLIWTYGKFGFESALLAEAPQGIGGMDLLFWQRGAIEITSELLGENGMDVVVPRFRGGRVRETLIYSSTPGARTNCS